MTPDGADPKIHRMLAVGHGLDRMGQRVYRGRHVGDRWSARQRGQLASQLRLDLLLHMLLARETADRTGPAALCRHRSRE